MKSLFVAAFIGSMAASAALAAPGVWQGTGPFATGLGDHVINALAVSGDGAMLYAGTGSGTVFSYNATTWTIVVAANPPAGGGASCAPNPVVDGAGSTCGATPNTGYNFIGWSGDCSGASCVLANVTAAKSVTANFSLNSYLIVTTANPAAGGTVACTPNPVNYGGSASCSATPNAGYTFTGWSGDCSGASCVLANVTAAKSVTANFSLNSYLIVTTANPAAGGTVACTPNPVNYGGSASCSATPNAGYTFTGWSGDCSGASCALVNVTAARSVTANFVPNGTKTFVGASATGSGNVTASFTGGGVTCGYSSAQLIGASAPPPGVSFPHGLFDFTVANCAAGATLSFTITYPQPLPANTHYWQYGPTTDNGAPHWYTLPARITGNQITFSVVDGGLGDDDLTSNGTVVGQGGPGYAAETPAVATPALSDWAIVLLAILLVGLSLRGARAAKQKRETKPHK